MISTISEHEPRNEKSDKGPTYSPTAEERQAIKLAESLFEKAKTARGR